MTMMRILIRLPFKYEESRMNLLESRNRILAMTNISNDAAIDSEVSINTGSSRQGCTKSVVLV